MHRYGDMTYLMNLDIEDGYELINKAYEKELEERLWQQWLVDYNRMDKDTFVSFDDYKKKATRKIENKTSSSYKIKNLDKNKILDEAEEIRRLDREAEERKRQKQAWRGGV